MTLSFLIFNVQTCFQAFASTNTNTGIDLTLEFTWLDNSFNSSTASQNVSIHTLSTHDGIIMFTEDID